MISTFNLNKLRSLLKDFYTLTQIRISVFDDAFRELVAYPEHISQFCQIVRTDPNAFIQCQNCDKNACQTAAHRHFPYTYQCHAGLTESIMPLYMGNIVIGYLLFGHVFSFSDYEEGWNTISQLCSSYQLDFEKLKTQCFRLPLTSNEYITSAANIMQTVASYLCLERMAVLRTKDLPVQIDEYISRHYTENIDVQTICSHFQIGKTALYEISKQNYGVGIAEHIRNMRIEKAKAMLLEREDMNICQISQECGFSDYNYFISVFRRHVGIPPRQYRILQQKNFC